MELWSLEKLDFPKSRQKRMSRTNWQESFEICSPNSDFTVWHLCNPYLFEDSISKEYLYKVRFHGGKKQASGHYDITRNTKGPISVPGTLSTDEHGKLIFRNPPP